MKIKLLIIALLGIFQFANAATITVNSPNGGEILYKGCPTTITWSSTGVTGTVNIEITNASGTSPVVIQTSVSNTGSYNWTIPTGQATGTYKIKIYATSATSVVDLSNAAFTITSPTLTVTSPNGGEIFYQGNSMPIQWSSTGVCGTVNIEITNASGGGAVLIISSTSNSGSFSWTIPTTQAAGTYKIKIYVTTNTSVVDLSDAAFTIALPTLTVGSPNGGETFYQGGNMPISWSTVGMSSSENVSIELTQGTTTTIQQVIASPLSNNGSYNWTIPTSVPAGTYRVKIYRTNTASGTIVDYSNATFTIALPTLTVSSPNGGETFYQGGNMPISWSTVGMSSSENVSIELTQGTTTTIQQVIASPLSNNGSYNWTIPTSVPAGTYRVKIYRTNTASGTIVDYSNATFTIALPTLTVSSPNGGETFYQGGNMPISWSTVGMSSSENVSIELTQGTTTTIQQVIASPLSNNGSYNWTIPTSVPAGTYRVKIYRTNTASGTIVDYSNATFTIVAPSLTVTLPNGGETYSIGSTLIVNWTSTAVTGNLQIELENQTTAKLYRFGTQGTGVPISAGTFSGVIGDTVLPGQYKIKIYSLTTSTIKDFSNANFTINAFNYSCIQWQASSGGTPTVAELNTTYATAFEYLCNKSVIDKPQFKNQIDNKIKRDQVAKIIYRALYTPNISAPFPCDNFPSIYPDLIPNTANYIGEAKTLLYLEYRDATTGDLDGISPFDRDKTYFNPTRSILKHHYLKCLLEAFNKKPYYPATANFTDVPTTHESFGYVERAKQLGLLLENTTTTFGAADTITRKDAILWLYRIMKSYEVSGNYVAPTPTANDFFKPNNFCLFNGNSIPSIDKANFNTYTKTSFGIAGLMPLSFAHSYNSVLTELPAETFYDQPLGAGWTHNYNCYIIRTVDDQNANARVTIHWGDGSTISYKESGTNYISETEGNYATLTRSGTSLIYKTKGQMEYTFIFQSSSFFTLNTIKDRNGNTLSLGWLVGTGGKYRLNSVTDPAGRRLQYNYITGTNLLSNVQAITGSITRTVTFTYKNSNTDLASFTDPRNKTTQYNYAPVTNPARAHLLITITLPKGNTVNNTYQDRKLTSSNFVGQYNANVSFTQNYGSMSATNFTQSSVTTTRGTGQSITTTVRHDSLGLPKNIVSPTGNLDITYNAAQKTKPSTFTNTALGITATTNYDANGNVLSVSKTGTGISTITESFTYNSFNDILTYQNGRGYNTTFGYNATGNLTSIQDALGNTTNMVVNANGTVAKVTNPAGIYTNFTYDAYGNTTNTSLQGTINASATYDDASRLIQKIDPRGIKTYMYYLANDAVSRVVSDTGGLNNAINYLYDDNDNLTNITNPKGGVTTLTYNNYDQLTTYSFGGINKTYAYNDDGTLKTLTNKNGANVFNYTYNSDGTLQTDGYATYTYDANKNIKTITKGSGTITFNYDGLNRANQIRYNDFASNNVAYTYDNNNNVTSITYPTGFKVGYEYDALDRLTRVYNFSTNANYAAYTYLADGRLNTQTNGNGTKSIFRYDALGRLDSIANLTSSNNVICAYGFKMDNVGNHLSETANEPSFPTANFPRAANISYTHDAGNRMTNRATSTFNYDNNGNNTQATGQWNSNYTYDTKDNLLTSTSPGLTCEYDALENRRLKNNTRYVLDILGGSNVLMEANTTGTAQAHYIYGLGLICRLDAAQANPAYYHYDYRGSTTAITNSSQTVTHKYKYGPFGEMLNAQETGFTNVFRYVGKYGVQFDDSTLYFMRARYYNAYKGRFLGEDPIWNSNLYEYSQSNPINDIDPSGKLNLAQTYKLGGITGSGGIIGYLNNQFNILEGKSDCSYNAFCSVAESKENEWLKNLGLHLLAIYNKSNQAFDKQSKWDVGSDNGVNIDIDFNKTKLIEIFGYINNNKIFDNPNKAEIEKYRAIKKDLDQLYKNYNKTLSKDYKSFMGPVFDRNSIQIKFLNKLIEADDVNLFKFVNFK